jgi:hypothetical protein
MKHAAASTEGSVERCIQPPNVKQGKHTYKTYLSNYFLFWPDSQDFVPVTTHVSTSFVVICLI